MSHYTAIKTKYKNAPLLKECINKLSYPYTEHKGNLEVYIIPSRPLTCNINNAQYVNYLCFDLKELSYSVVADFQSWTQRDILGQFLKKLELNYGYSETISQALELGFIRSKRVLDDKQKNKFVFQRCIEIKN